LPSRAIGVRGLIRPGSGAAVREFAAGVPAKPSTRRAKKQILAAVKKTGFIQGS